MFENLHACSQARRSDAASHLSEVWDIDRDVPHSLRETHTRRFKTWLDLTSDEMEQLQLPPGDLDAVTQGDDVIDRWVPGTGSDLPSKLLGD